MRPSFRWIAALAVLFASRGAEAQVLGTFSWQTQPYCNVITLRVVQEGGNLFQLIGSDDLCGAGVAPVTGTGVLAGGSVAFGLTVAPATGRPAQIAATIALSTISGTWTDGDGRTGAFTFGPVAPSGAPRPSPGPRVQRLTYTGVLTMQATGASPAKLRDIGTFTSTAPGVKVTWTSHGLMNAGANSCVFQLRIDGQLSGPPGNGGFAGDDAVMASGAVGAVPITAVAWFPNVAAGVHTIELWVRAQNGGCSENTGNFTRTVLVEEIGAVP